MNPETTSTQVEKTKEELKKERKNAWMRAYRKRRFAENPQLKLLHKDYMRKWRRHRYATDPVWRAKTKAAAKASANKLRADGSTWVKQHNAKLVALRSSDPVARARYNEYQREWARNKYATDPVYRSKMIMKGKLKYTKRRTIISPPPLLSLLATSQVVSQSLDTIESNG